MLYNESSIGDAERIERARGQRTRLSGKEGIDHVVFEGIGGL